MENKEKINLHLTGEKPEAKIYHGQLPDPINFKEQVINGTIDAPSEFWKKRRGSVRTEDKLGYSTDGLNYSYDASYVTFNHQDNTIQLVVNAAHPGQITVNGSFIVNKVFNDLKVNVYENGEYRTHNELLGKLRYASDLFESLEALKAIIQNLKNFTLKVNRDFEQWSKTSGDSGIKVSTKVSEVTPLDFDIFVPIFNGEEKSKVKLSVEIEDRNNNLVFFLVSYELPILIEQHKTKRFSELKKDFTDIAVINK